MSFNFGAFAGGVAQGGANTYKMLKDVESQQKRDALVDLQTKEAEQAMQGREALRSAIAEQGGEKTFTPNFNGTGGIDSNDVAPTPVTQTGSQRISGAAERAIAMGADPMQVMQYKQAARADLNADTAQKAFDWMQASDKAVAEKGLVKAAEEYLLPHYNSNSGLMNDGMTAKIVTTKTGPVVQFLDAKGNIQNSMTQPLTLDSFSKARDMVGASMLSASGPDAFYKNREYGLKKEEVGAKTALVPSEIAKNKAMANQANAHAGLFGNMLQAAKDSKAAGEAMKPFIDKFSSMTPEQQAGQEGQAVLIQAATAGAKVSKDVGAILSTLRKPDRATVSAEHEKAAYAELAGAGTNPETIRAVKAKWPEVFGPSALDKAIAARANSKPAEPAPTTPAATPAAAIPIEQKFIRSKSNRGGFTYTPSPRGMTKAQWGALDAEKSSASE